MFEKLLRPGDGRRNRWRTARDEPVPLSRLLRNAPRALGTFVMARLFDHRPTQPWIGYDAIRRLDTILRPDMAALEYGSGMSTMWFARRVGSIIAVEDDAKWGAFQRTKLVRERIANVEIVISNDREGYLRPPAVATQMERGGFDFIMIDGRYRDGCAEAAVGMIKPGGAIYLDNSDVTQFNNLDGNLENARQTLQSAALERGGSVEAFVDFAPGLLFATSGHLYRF